MTDIAPMAVLRSGSVAPVFSRLRGELRPQGGAPVTGNDDQAAGGAGSATGYRPWSPPIT